MLGRSAWAVLLLSLGGAGGLHAQTHPPPASELTLTVELAAAGARYMAGRGAWRLGAGVSAGSRHGLELMGDGAGDVRLVAAAYPVVSRSLGTGMRLLMSPLGAALISGNDFLGVYPSAQAGVEIVRGRLRLGSVARVVRIAGTEGSGDYLVTWSPLRLGVALSW